MNESEIDRIAAAVNCLRPDWPVASLRAILNRPDLVRRGRRDVAVALVWVACEPVTSTPARVLESGPWWRAAGVEGDVTHGPPKRDGACLLCGKPLARCICGERQTRPPTPVPPTDAWKQARKLRGGSE